MAVKSKWDEISDSEPARQLRGVHMMSAPFNLSLRTLNFLRLFQRETASVRILVIGGGPAGLAFATSVKHLLGNKAAIAVHDARWKPVGSTVQWMDRSEGMNRRDQVVTLQSAVIDRLPAIVKAALFPAGGWTDKWPTGGESPREIGYPRNIRISDIENRLLALAQTQGIELVPDRVRPEMVDLQRYNLIVIADGARSRFRDYYVHRFGAEDAAPYSANGRQLEDVVLGLRVTTRMPDADQVLLTVAQQRLLANTSLGDGYIYLRLTPEEAAEVRGRKPNGAAYVDCIQREPCTMRSNGAGSHVCETHGTVFVPAEDPNSYLWPRVLEALELFDVRKENLHALTTFRLSMAHRPRFTAELTQTGSNQPVFGALIGDAANQIHIWPGRGMASGLSSAVSLMRALIAANLDRPLRNADFVRHEAAMHALQHRHKDRAWRNMVLAREGAVRPISSVIGDTIAQPSVPRRRAVDLMRCRLKDLDARLSSRLPGKTNVEGLMRRLETLSEETLSVFVEAGPWETRWSGGSEVDLDQLNPMSFRKDKVGVVRRPA